MEVYMLCWHEQRDVLALDLHVQKYVEKVSKFSHIFKSKLVESVGRSDVHRERMLGTFPNANFLYFLH